MATTYILHGFGTQVWFPNPLGWFSFWVSLVGFGKRFQKNMSNIQEKIQEEVQSAREACDVSGTGSKECAAAWDAVEELQAEAAHQKQEKPKNSLEVFCSDNPDAAECRIYED
jgi:hypothetical protein